MSKRAWEFERRLEEGRGNDLARKVFAGDENEK